MNNLSEIKNFAQAVYGEYASALSSGVNNHTFSVKANECPQFLAAYGTPRPDLDAGNNRAHFSIDMRRVLEDSKSPEIAAKLAAWWDAQKL